MGLGSVPEVLLLHAGMQAGPAGCHGSRVSRKRESETLFFRLTRKKEIWPSCGNKFEPISGAFSLGSEGVFIGSTRKKEIPGCGLGINSLSFRGTSIRFRRFFRFNQEKEIRGPGWKLIGSRFDVLFFGSIIFLLNPIKNLIRMWQMMETHFRSTDVTNV